jgi:hypothetical protein
MASIRRAAMSVEAAAELAEIAEAAEYFTTEVAE